MPQTPRGMRRGGGGILLPTGEGSGEGAVPFTDFFVFLFKIPYFYGF